MKSFKPTKKPALPGTWGVTLKEVLLGILLFAVINGFSGYFQPSIDIGGGVGWDGGEYYRYALEIVRHQNLFGYAPKIWRVGTPYLAAKINGEHLRTGFLIANLEANFLVVLLWPFCMALWIKDWKTRLVLSFLFQTNWIGPIRFAWFCPVLCDYWPLVFLLVSLIVMAKFRDSTKAALTVSLLSFAGSLFRENLLIIPLAYLFVGVNWRFFGKSFFQRLPVRIMPLLAFGSGLLILHHLVQLDEAFFPGNVSGRSQAFNYMTEALDYLSRFHPANFILAWFATFGPILALPLFGLRFPPGFLARNAFLLILLILYTFLSAVGGGDFERYLIWLSPVIYALAGMAMEQGPPIFKRRWAIGLFFFLQLVSQRFFWMTPGQFPSSPSREFLLFLSPLGKGVQYVDLLSFYETPGIVYCRLVQYLSVTLLFFSLNRFLQRRNRS